MNLEQLTAGMPELVKITGETDCHIVDPLDHNAALGLLADLSFVTGHLAKTI